MDYKKEIKKHGLSFRFVAGKIGVNAITFNGYLNSVSNMPLDVEKRLKNLLKKYN